MEDDFKDTLYAEIKSHRELEGLTDSEMADILAETAKQLRNGTYQG